MGERKKVLELFDEQKEFLEEKVNFGIEQYRKGYANLVVKDSEGKPVSGAKIKLNQKSHEFRFGANLFMLDELETDEKNDAYKKCFADTFNMATLPFYWDATEPEKGKTRYDKDSDKLYRRPAIDLCIEFCEKHGIEPREHALAYDAFFPKWLYGASVSEVKLVLEKRYKEISERYKDKIPTIEVTNEMEWVKGKTAFYDEPDYVEWCFKLAEKYFSANQLVINEHTSASWADKCRPTDKYYAYTEAAILKGARIDAVGMQYHMFYNAEEEYEKTRPYYNPENLYKHMDLYSNFGKPLQVTLHDDGRKLIGRAVTATYCPFRPDLDVVVKNIGKSEGRTGTYNQWVIDNLVEYDVPVIDMYDKIYKGTFLGGNLTTALKNKTKNENGGAVIWGGIRDTEQMKKVENTQVYYRGIDPTPIRDFIMTGYNTATRIGNAICLPGDIVFGAGGGVLFIPSHLVAEVVGGAAKTQVKDLFGFEMISLNKFTTAQIDKNTWTKEMLDLLMEFIENDDRAAEYRGLDWSDEYDLAINGDPNDTQSAL